VSVQVLQGDCRAVLATLPPASVQCCVTSPPYFGLRDYGVDGQIGLEQSPDAYVAEMVAVFRDVRRALRDDGTLWLNIGDSYASSTKGSGGDGTKSGLRRDGRPDDSRITSAKLSIKHQSFQPQRIDCGDAKPKDLLMIPARVALALQADGWWLRSDIIWHKPNPMPESCTDRCTSAHEHVFLLTKRATYFYDAEAAMEEITSNRAPSRKAKASGAGHVALGRVGPAYDGEGTHRNARNVWTIATQPFSGAHFATMPPDLAERCIRAGSRPGDMILDPFGGAGTTALVADRLGRDATLIELNPEYAALARSRIADDAGLFSTVTA